MSANTPATNINNDSTTISDYHKMELQEVFNRTSTFTSLRVQIYSFFGTANLGLLGFALTSRLAGLILIAAGIIGLLALVDRQILRYQIIWYSRGLQLEEKYASDKESALLHQAIVRTGYLQKGVLRRYWLPAAIFAVEVLMAVLSWWLLGWAWG